MKWEVEVTDTFCGQASYSWCDRCTLDLPEGTKDRQLAKAFKAAAGMTGDRGKSFWHGDTYEFRPYNRCVLLFASLCY